MARDREKKLEYNRRWKESNPEKVSEHNRRWREAHREKAREFDRRWKEAHPEKVREYNRRRRARRKGNEALLVTPKDLQRQAARQNNRCYYCKERPIDDWDHIIPVRIRFGRHSIGNLVGACAQCNKSKNGALLIAWRKRTGLKLV